MQNATILFVLLVFTIILSMINVHNYAHKYPIIILELFYTKSETSTLGSSLVTMMAKWQCYYRMKMITLHFIIYDCMHVYYWTAGVYMYMCS